jgi:hypothetical protein
LLEEKAIICDGRGTPQLPGFVSRAVYHPGLAFQLTGSEEFAQRGVPGDGEKVWLAADLAVLHIALPPTRRLVHNNLIPLSTARALETRWKRHINLKLSRFS